MKKTNKKNKVQEEIDSLKEDIQSLRFKTSLILCGIRNLLEQNNPNGVNDYLINQMDRNRYE
jgi:hypothetical protein